MRRFIFLSTMVYGLLIAGLVSLRAEFIALAIPFALYLLAALLGATEPLNLRIERHIPNDRVAPGADVAITLTIQNRGLGIQELLIEDRIAEQLQLKSGSNRHLLQLPGGSSATRTYVLAGPRGSYAFETVQIQAMDSLGLIRRELSVKIPGQLFVFPFVRRLRAVSIRPRRTRVYAGSIPARLGGTGIEFFGVREYQRGDSPRMINWHVSARHAEALYSNEFQQERVADVGIVLDARERTNQFRASHSLFEHSVLAAASLADALISSGNRVGLLVYGSYLSWTLPGYGKIQRERIMQSLAGARVGASSVFAGLEHLSTRMFPQESQLVLISSLVRDDLSILIQLRARGFQLMVISPDPIRFERGALPASREADLAARVIRMERALVIRRLERAGVQVIEWDVAQLFDQAIGPQLMRSSVSRWRRM